MSDHIPVIRRSEDDIAEANEQHLTAAEQAGATIMHSLPDDQRDALWDWLKNHNTD